MATEKNAERRLSMLESLLLVFRSRRTAAVTLQMFFSGMPLGLVWIAIPAWMARVGIDIRAIGLITLTQAPWTFKFLWAPLMDRYSPPFLGRKRGWMVVAQIALLVVMLALAGVAMDPRAQPQNTPGENGVISETESSGAPEAPSLEWIWVVGALTLAVAFASTVQDIAIDAYAVEVLRKEEHGVAVGARTALYRAGMMVAGAAAITVAASISWPVTLAGLGLLYILGMIVSAWSPEVEKPPPAPSNLRAAVWEPLVGLASRNRAVEIVAFLFLYKFGDNVAQALLRPFLVQMGYGDFDVGIASGTIGMFGMIGGTFLGGIITSRIGLGHALWIFGFLQAVSNLGYIWIASVEPTSPIMYAAMGFETLTQGTGTGAFFVLLLRLTQKQFSATQYALLSSIFALGRVVTGPIAGFMVDAMGWRPFFVLTIVGSVPGLVFLHRFVPFGSREPRIAPEKLVGGTPVGRAALVSRGLAGAVTGLLIAALVSASLQAIKAYRVDPEGGFPLGSMMAALTRPETVAAWAETFGVVLFGLFVGLGTAAMIAARRGVGSR
jgi:PAT family beta-lactamase induction signal transducer AmpG